MDTISLIGAGIIVMIILMILTKSKHQNNKKDKLHKQELTDIEPKNFPYVLKNCIFSNNENKFYLSAKKITDKYSLILFSKMRIADIVEVSKKQENYIRWFNKIKSKHIDFIICDINLKPVLIIEVDDSSHDREKRIQRDKFVDEIFCQVNLPILHIRLWKDEELEKQIKEVLKIA